MLKKVSFLMALFFLGMSGSAQTLPRMARTEVMILGTYHMDNPGLDLVKAPLDDHLSARRQREILEVVQRIARYRPTKILLESAYGTQGMNDRYAGYRAGTYKLTADERDQLGIRLAHRLGHARVYPIDYAHDMDIAAVLALARKQGDKGTLDLIDHGLKEIGRMMARRPRISVRQALWEDNSPRADAFTQGMYNLLLRINEEPSNYKGTEVVAGWYHRNLRIFANIAKTIRPGDGRVLVIIGAGHAPILRQLVREAPDMKLVDPVGYLR